MRTISSCSPLVFLLAVLSGGAAFAYGVINLSEEYDIEVYARVQMWNLYTRHARDENGQSVDDRWDLFLRRGRLGFQGRVREDIDYRITFAYSGIGKNEYTGAPAGTQDRENDEFSVWDAYFTWALDPDWLNITMGYLKPRVGRENNTAAWKVNSLEKALTSGYLRRHLVDAGPGRETGLNIGGLYHPDRVGFHYYFGVFDTDHDEIDGKPGGSNWSPMLAGRWAFTLGDPESDEYKLGYAMNYWGERNGTSLGVNYAYQGETDGFERNGLFGLDLLANYGDLSFSAEQEWMKRDVGSFSYTDKAYHLRAGYNVHLDNGQIIEPAFMFTRFKGDDRSVDFPDFAHEMQDLGLNWYVDKERFKINIHYVWQDDDAGRGDFFGLGVQLYF